MKTIQVSRKGYKMMVKLMLLVFTITIFIIYFNGLLSFKLIFPDKTVLKDLPNKKYFESSISLSAKEEKHKKFVEKTQVLLPGKYNLVEDAAKYNGAMQRPPKECTLEYMNYNRLAQDHPCVVNYIRNHFLNEPAPSYKKLNLDYPNVKDQSQGQPKAVLEVLSSLGYPSKGGFFVECGALDGENLSNTLYLEREFNWTGILIEADQDSFRNLLKKNRNSWSLPVCLSLKPYPTTVTFYVNYALGKIIGNDQDAALENTTVMLPVPDGYTSTEGRNITVQCFPLYSIMLAVNRSLIDVFSLDIEGDELKVLKTIPLHKLLIKTFIVEWASFRDNGKEKLKTYMMSQGYKSVIPTEAQHDIIFYTENNNDSNKKV